MEAYSLGQVRWLFEVNFYGVLRMYQAVLPAMRQAKQGLLINLSTGASGHALPFWTSYQASKFAVEAMTEGIQQELRAYYLENVTIQTGMYPPERTTARKRGYKRTDIVAAYGEAAVAQFNKIGTARATKRPTMDPQVIVEGVLSLVNMVRSPRPLRLPWDSIADETDQEFIDARASPKTRWLTK